MLNTNKTLFEAFVPELLAGYRETFGGLKPHYAEIIAWAGRMALENIANSDALYHNTEHTLYVTLVGQEILKGKHIREGGVTCEDWLHTLISLQCHDIGYVKGVCRTDDIRSRIYATGQGEETVTLPPGATDAGLTPYHVDRGKQFIRERFGGHLLIDSEIIQANMELTRFPVPLRNDTTGNQDYPDLVRSADLIGQLSDPRYLEKIPALFYEFEETGVNRNLGYRNPHDLRLGYPSFYWKSVYPYVEPALNRLRLTQTGRQIVANLHGNVLEVAHEQGLAQP